MNLVLDDAEEIHSKTKSRKQLGKPKGGDLEPELPFSHTSEHKTHIWEVEFGGQGADSGQVLVPGLVVLVENLSLPQTCFSFPK